MTTTHVPMLKEVYDPTFSSFSRWEGRQAIIQLSFISQLSSKLMLPSLHLFSTSTNRYLYSNPWFLTLQVIIICSRVPTSVVQTRPNRAQYFYLLRETTVKMHRDYIYMLTFWWTCRDIFYMYSTIPHAVVTGKCDVDVEAFLVTYDNFLMRGKNE